MKKTGIYFILMFFITFLLPLNTISLIGESEERVFLIKEEASTEFSIEFIHSIYHVLQIENYEIKDKAFILRNVYFGSYDAANYYDPILAKDMKELSDGGFVLEDINFKIEQVKFALGHGTNYSIIINGKKVNLNEDFSHSVFLRIQIEKMSLLQYLIRRV